MKKINQSPTLRSLFILSALLVSGCGESKKNPVGDDLHTIREYGKQANQTGSQKPVVIKETVVVEKPKLVRVEESTIDDKFIVITPDPQMSFNEGQASVYKIRARVLIPDVQVVLTASGLPTGATLTSSTTEKDLYLLKWTPALYTIPQNSYMKVFTAKLVAQVANPEVNADAQKLKGLIREQEVSLFLFHNQELPSDLKVSGLPTEVLEGSDPIPFTVTAKVPGMDDKSPIKPSRVVSYDRVSYTAGHNFLEHDGSRYIYADPNKKEPEYIGDSQWRFSMLFDAKNIPVQPQQAKDGSTIKNADGLRVRVSFKVYNNLGLSTPETLYQLKIKYIKNVPVENKEGPKL